MRTKRRPERNRLRWCRRVVFVLLGAGVCLAAMAQPPAGAQGIAEMMRQAGAGTTMLPGGDCAELWTQVEDQLRSAGRDPHEMDAQGIDTPLMRCPPRAGEVGAQTQTTASSPAEAPAAQQQQRVDLCRFFIDDLRDPDQRKPMWGSPNPVVLARFFTDHCDDHAALLSAAETGVVEGLVLFGVGKFDASAAAFAQAAINETDRPRKIRYEIETARSRIALGSTEGVAFSLQQHASAESVPMLLRIDAHNLLAQLAAAQGNLPAAVEAALAAETLAKEGYGHDLLPDATMNAFLATLLMRTGQVADAELRLDAILGGREQMLGGTDIVGRMLASPMMQGMMAGQGIDPNEAAAGMETSRLMSGDMLVPRFACTTLADLHIERGDTGAALEVIERCRGRVLARLLANRAFHATPDEQPLDLMAIASMAPSEKEIRSYAKTHGIDEGEASQQIMMERIRGPSAAAARPATLVDMQNMARQRQATLLIYAIDHAAAVLPGLQPDREIGITIGVVGPGGEVTVRRRALDLALGKGPAPLTAAILAARDSMGVQGRGIGDERPRRLGRADLELRKFYDLLIAPVEDLLPRKQGSRLILVPEGALLMLPFAALQDETGVPLVERYALSEVPSLQTLALAASRRRSGSRERAALVIGNPVMPQYQPEPGGASIEMPRLPAAGEEALAVAEILGTTALTGADATESAVRERLVNAGTVHLATHGILDEFVAEHLRDVDPYVRSFMAMGEGAHGALRTPGLLALAADQLADGLFFADEIAESSTSADLVVMSACDSGLGTINDDGVIGLSRAWMAAGAASVVVSLWAIPDAPTRDLMVAFYQRLAAGSAKDAAMREAMLAVRKNHTDPASWAAFTVIGEPD